MAGQSRLRMRTMVIALSVAAVIGVGAAFWAHLHVAYARQATAGWNPAAPGTAFANMNFGSLADQLRNPQASNPAVLAGVGIGAAVTLVLARLTTVFCGFPFHPAGYALAISFAMDYFWFAFLVSWLIKVVLTRYWGMKVHREGVHFFLGLILGDYVCGSIWAILGPAIGRTNYKIFI